MIVNVFGLHSFVNSISGLGLVVLTVFCGEWYSAISEYVLPRVFADVRTFSVDYMVISYVRSSLRVEFRVTLPIL